MPGRWCHLYAVARSRNARLARPGGSSRVSARISPTRSEGHSVVIGWPMISSAEYPYMRAAAGFQLVIIPSGVFPTIGIIR